MTDADHRTTADAVRRFSRFYTRRLGVLREGLLGSPLSLAEARLLFEINAQGETTAAALCQALDLDPGHVSRLLAKLAGRDLLAKQPSTTDGRQVQVSLTADGAAMLQDINQRSDREVAGLVGRLTATDQDRLVGAMAAIERLLTAPAPADVVLRAPRAGDYGWVVAQHGEAYAREHGFTGDFEALVAKLMAAFIDTCDPAHERAWIAEVDGDRVGCVFAFREDEEAVRLRCLFLRPEARGLGIGKRLVTELIGFARDAGYRRVILSTHSTHLEARALYTRLRFSHIQSVPVSHFGHDLVAEDWELPL